MNLAISNIAWNTEDNQYIYALMQKYGFSGLEVAPKKIFSDFRTVSQEEKDNFQKHLLGYDIHPIAMQSLLFGEEGLFLFQEDGRKKLFSYLSDLITFWAPLGIRSFVFGSPKNRIYKDMPYTEACNIARGFFRSLGIFCQQHDVSICIEPNPAIYGGNFLQTTKETLEFVNSIGIPQIKLNLDMGAIIYEGLKIEEVSSMLSSSLESIGHFHISEPGLGEIQIRDIHLNIIKLLKGYDGYISVEMRETTIQNIEHSFSYLASFRNIF